MSDSQPGPVPASEDEPGDKTEQGPESPWADHPDTDDVPVADKGEAKSQSNIITTSGV